MSVKVLMLGCDMQAPGGISSVVKTYSDAGLFSNGDVKYISTYSSSIKVAMLVNFLVAVLKLLCNLIVHRPKIVHVHSASKGSFWRKFLILKISKWFGSKTIFHLHSGEFPDFFQRQSTANKQRIVEFLTDVDRIVALTPFWRDKLLDIAPKAKVVVLMNPVEEVAGERIKQKNHILFLGRLRKEKGIYELIEAAKILNSQGLSFKLTIAGDGDIERFQRVIDESNLTDQIDLVGWVSGSKKDKLILSSDIFVLPSYFEGLPISVLEAMINRIVVVATNVGGIPDVVIDGSTGFLVESHQSTELAEVFAKLINDEFVKEQIREKAYHFACEKFETNQIINHLNSIYEIA